jgi:hypothetical protein
MAVPLYNINTTGQFVPTTYIFDPAELQQLDISPEFKETLIRLYQNLNRMQFSLNGKTTGSFPLNQTVTGQLYFPKQVSSSFVNQYDRPVTRLVVNCGTLGNAGVTTTPHGIIFNKGVSFVRIYGTATDPVNFLAIPLPYASPVLANNIELSVDATNVIITTGSNRTNFTITYVVLEFLTM